MCYGCDRLNKGLSLELDIERLQEAMHQAYQYKDRDNSIPELPFVDDVEAFWRPFTKLVAAEYQNDEG